MSPNPSQRDLQLTKTAADLLKTLAMQHTSLPGWLSLLNLLVNVPLLELVGIQVLHHAETVQDIRCVERE